MTIERKYLDAAHAVFGKAEPAVVDNTGAFTGWPSTSGNVDLGGDKVIAGAFGFKGTVELPLLLHHKTDSPAGLITVSEEAYGLRGVGQLNMDVQAAREARALMRQGAMTGLSIGYKVIDSFRRDGVRFLTKIALHEVSLVAFPMNPKARVTSVKAAQEAEEWAAIAKLSREMRDYFRRAA